MLGINLRYLGIVGGGSSAGSVSLSDFLGSKISPMEAEVARHGKSASKVQRSSMLDENAADACNISQSGFYIIF
jgi:hypothetical protein